MRLVKPETNLASEEFDCVIVIAIKASNGYLQGVTSFCPDLLSYLTEYKEADDNFDKDTSFILLPPNHKFRKVIYSPVGQVNRDYDDVRRFAEAAFRGAKRAIKAGCLKPLIIIPTLNGIFHQLYPFYDVATVLGAYEALYTPLELREIPGPQDISSALKFTQLSFCNFPSDVRARDVFRLAEALERGRNVCRDIGGSDPERMSTLNVVSYVETLFSGSSVRVEVISDPDVIKRDFPCLSIVDRGSLDRHRARIIFLSYEPTGQIDQTLILVGKGVTYDTGGADVKAGGIMAGMHRDKCGAAAVAGFFQTLEILRPKGLKVYGAMPMVRNSLGPDGYVADELVVSRSGVRIRIGNTDAEGRMEMVDCLTFYKERVTRDITSHPNPQFFSIATLTGHACLAAGEYSIIMDNGPARYLDISRKIAKAGEQIGDLFEISSIRREDYEFNKGKSEYEDILQCNNLPSSRTPRGHQVPAAFLLQVSGLDRHGLDSKLPIPFSHIDIAASSGPFPGIPSGSPVPALAVHYLLSRDCSSNT